MNAERGQIEQMLSERLDGTLTAEELARLDRALAEDPAAAKLARQYQGLQELLAAWRALPDDLDWKSLTTSVGDIIRKHAARRSAGPSEPREDIDDLIHTWAGSLPPVDWSQFKQRVSSDVRREAAAAESLEARTVAARRRPTRRTWKHTAKWLATVGAPLAAAAVIAIAVWWPGATQMVNRYGAKLPAAPQVLVALDIPERSGHVAITFEQGPAEGGQSAASGDEGGTAVAFDSAAVEPAESVDDIFF